MRGPRRASKHVRAVWCAVILLLACLPATSWAGVGAPGQNAATPRAVLDCTKSSTPDGVSPGTSRLLASLAGSVIWQPRDGTIRFTITAPQSTTPTSLDNIEVAVCFGWPQLVFATADTDRTPKLYAATSLRTIARTDNAITYETTLPDLLWSHENDAFAPSFFDGFKDFVRYWRGETVHVYDGWGIVPIVHMRIMARSLDASPTSLDPNSLDTVLPVGISFRIVALIITLLAVAVAWGVLFAWAEYRGIPGDPILRLIANQSGYASLSQFQILLWTVVIGAGITYVMMLSGSLIDVPDQVLALLGISGFSALSAAYAARQKSVSKAQAAPAQPAQPPPAVSPQRLPRWSDLVVWDGTGEIDITRVQMLIFTALAAVFVVIKIVDESAIPEVPDGIVLLMGLTNGVYVGGKFVSDRR